MVSLKRERGWADPAHATELQSVFCSVVRIGRSGGDGPIRPTLQNCSPSSVVSSVSDNRGGHLAERRAKSDGLVV